MTFSELKFKLKREGSLGNKVFYAVPRVDYSIAHGPDKYMELPFVLGVSVTANKYGKKILTFDTLVFGGNTQEEMHFFLDKEMADVYTIKLQAIKHTRLIDDLKAFEYATKINTRLPLFIDKFPEVFV